MKSDEHKKPVKTARVILIVLLLAALVGGVYWYFQYRGQLYTEDAEIQTNHVTVAFKMFGQIKKLNFSEGDLVIENDPLGSLEDAESIAQHALLEQAVHTAELNLQLSEINLENAQRDFDRVDSLSSNSKDFISISRENYDNIVKGLEIAKVQVEISKAQIESAKEQLMSQEIQMQNLDIHAPISGTIVNLNAAEGEIVQPGQNIYQINDLSQFWVMANFDETDIQQIKPESIAQIMIDAYPKETFSGRVSQVRGGIVPPPFSIGEGTKTTQKIPVRVDFDPVPDLVVRPGMSVEVKINVADRKRRLFR